MSIGPGRSRDLLGYLLLSLCLKGLTWDVWKVGKRLGVLGVSKVTVEASGKEATTR